eukprot:snap_masked-scaffold_2-processed-gene-18.47-mRNA-1 protein AED:1.00 eAED:1.00 QI:0/0/0/0/1/1/2/0/373
MCIDFPNLCGVGGTCNVQTNLCECEDGWSQSFEMIYFPFVKQDISNKTDLLEQMPCTRNDGLLFTVFLFSFLGSIFAAVFHLPLLKTKKRFFRQLPLMMCFGVFIFAYGIRVFDVNREYAEDGAFSVFLGIGFTLTNFSVAVFISKYVSYHLNKMRKALGTKLFIFGLDLSKYLKWMIPVQLFFVFILTILFLLPLAIKRKKTAGINILQVGLVSCIALNGIIKDMTMVTEGTPDKDKLKNKFYLYCVQAIPNIRLMIKILCVHCGTYGILSSLYVFSVRVEAMMIYIVGTFGLAFSILSCLIGYFFTQNTLIAQKLKKFTSDSKTSTTAWRPAVVSDATKVSTTDLSVIQIGRAQNTVSTTSFDEIDMEAKL